MSKEEDLKKFDLEYSLFEVDSVNSSDELNGFYEVFLDDIEEYNESFHSQIKDNKIRKRKAILSNYFAFFIGYEFPEYYDKDNETYHVMTYSKNKTGEVTARSSKIIEVDDEEYIVNPIKNKNNGRIICQ